VLIPHLKLSRAVVCKLHEERLTTAALEMLMGHLMASRVLGGVSV